MDSFVGWIGGKKALRNKIIAQFPKEIPKSYIEVFGGGGWVLFKKEKYSKQLEIFNDINSDLVNLFRCVKYHREAVEKELEYMLASREMFFDCKNQMDCRGLTDIQRAAKYFFIIKTSFGSDCKTFATNGYCGNGTLKRLDEIQKRLSGVLIENKDFEDIISTYDKESALFYLDPPYHRSEKYYKYKFDENDHISLKDALENIKGKFILSYNDDEFVRELYKDYLILPVERSNMLQASTNNKKFSEVIIKNF